MPEPNESQTPATDTDNQSETPQATTSPTPPTADPPKAGSGISGDDQPLTSAGGAR